MDKLSTWAELQLLGVPVHEAREVFVQGDLTGGLVRRYYQLAQSVGVHPRWINRPLGWSSGRSTGIATREQGGIPRLNLLEWRLGRLILAYVWLLPGDYPGRDWAIRVQGFTSYLRKGASAAIAKKLVEDRIAGGAAYQKEYEY